MKKATSPASASPYKKTESTLYSKVIKGGFWVFAMRMVQQVLALGRLIVLARLLTPEDFGLVGIAMITMSLVATFTQTGFQAALIQKKGRIEPYLNTVWTIGIVRGCILFIIVWTMAPLVADFFGSPNATRIIQVLAIMFIVGALSNVGTIFFSKELDFHKQFILQFFCTLTDVVVAITLAFIYRSVWAIVLGTLAANIVGCVLSYTIHEYRPRFHWDLQKTKELFGFGKWVFGSSILGFILMQGDDVVLGKIAGITALGLYQMAYKISNLPTTEITDVVARVSFPAISKLQDDTTRLRNAYLKILKITALFSIPIAGLIIITSPDFVRLFMNEKWLPIVTCIQILAIWGTIRAVGATSGPLFVGSGYPKIATRMQMIKIVFLAILIVPLTQRWEISGTAMAVLISSLLVQPFVGMSVCKVIHCHPKDLIRCLTTPLLAMMTMMAVMYLLKYWFFQSPSFISFTFVLLIGSFIYIGLVWLLDILFHGDFRSILKEQIAVLLKPNKQQSS